VLGTRVIQPSFYVLQEILVGIMGNLSCVPSVRKEIAERVNIIRMLLELLSLPDVPTLLQLMRVLQACVWDLRNGEAINLSSEISEEKSESHGDETTVSSKPETFTEHSELGISPALKLRAGEKVDECSSCIPSAKQSKHIGKLSEQKSLECHRIDEVSQYLESCVVDLEQSRLKSYALHEPDHTGNPQVMESHILVPEHTDNESNDMSDSINNKQFNSNEESNKEKNEVDSLWLQELCDVNKWLPSIAFILRSSTNGKFLYVSCTCILNGY
jgi:hypothetical protein